MKTTSNIFLFLLCTIILPIFPQPNFPYTDSIIQYPVYQPKVGIKQPDLSGEVERSETKRDNRIRINVPEYDPSLMPLKSVRTATGIWTELNPKVPRVDYLGIHFINKDTCWACGANGALIKTTDGGQSWININSQTSTHQS